ncbi:MAG: methyltransferase, partial [Bacteroidales bacterium]|nr:methyltransferase [Bacteroidales bacterium]
RYTVYYNLVMPQVRPGGFIVADNVLWDGKVLDPQKNRDKDTLGIIDFNERVHHDERVENLMLPVRDGLMIIRKR